MKPLELIIPYAPHHAQAHFHSAPHKFKSIITGVGFGKSAAGSNETIRNIVQTPGGVSVVIAPTGKILKFSTMVQFWKFCPKEIVLKHNKSESEITFINGHKLWYFSADNERHIDRLRGIEIGYFWADEGRMFLGLVWSILLGRLRHPAGPLKGCLTTTPNGRDWIYRLFEEGLDPVAGKPIANKDDYIYWGGNTLQNPHLPDEYKRILMATYSGRFKDQEIYGKFTAFEGAVYDNFEHTKHIIKGQVKKRKGRIFIQHAGGKITLKHFVGGIDKGFTNPMAGYVVGFDADDRAYLLSEFYERRQHNKDIGRWFKERRKFYPISSIYVDPSAAETIEELEDMGLPAEPADNSVTEGISHMYGRFEIQSDGFPRLFVLERCENFIKEIQSYRYADKKEGKHEKEEPLKVDDHGMDAARYALYTDSLLRQDMDFSKYKYTDPGRVLF